MWSVTNIGIRDPARNLDDRYDLMLKVSTEGTVSISTTPTFNGYIKLRQFQYTVQLKGKPSVAYWFKASNTDSCAANVPYSIDEVQSVTVKYRE
jgi:hypothetical protein